MFEPMATIISACPFPITESKPGLSPGSFSIEPGHFLEATKSPSFLVIGPSTYSNYMGDDRYFTSTTSANSMAQSIVMDFKVAQLGYGAADCYPALIWVPDVVGLKEFSASKALKDLLEAQRIPQRNWLMSICRTADNDWRKYHHHGVVGDLQRKAAEILELDPREHEWLQITKDSKTERCPACQTERRPGAIVCHICTAVFDTVAYSKLTFGRKD